MASRQTGLRSLSITAARMPSSRSPSLAARQVKRYSRRERLLDAGVAAGGADQLERAGHRQRRLAARGSSARRGPSRWSRAGRRGRRGRRRRRRRRSPRAARRARRSGAGAAEGGDRRPGRRSSTSARGERRASAASGTKWSAKPARIASPGPMRWPVRPRYSPRRPGRARRAAGVPPTSGMRPIAHSGMATCVRLADDAVAAVAGDADAAAHDEAVHQRDVGLRVAGDPGVHPVLVGPEAAGRGRSRRGGRWRRPRRCRRRRRRRAGPRRRSGPARPRGRRAQASSAAVDRARPCRG